MNKKEARRIADRIAYEFLQQAIDTGAASKVGIFTEMDIAKIENALDDIIQRHFNRSDIELL